MARDWDRTERALKQLLAEVRIRRNASLPAISRLPSEVLTMIFSLVVYSDPPQVPISAPQMAAYEVMLDNIFDEFDINSWEDIRLLEPGTLGWICLSHVCTYWRNIVLHTPQFWADHLGHLPRRVPCRTELRGEAHRPCTIWLRPIYTQFSRRTRRVLAPPHRVAHKRSHSLPVSKYFRQSRKRTGIAAVAPSNVPNRSTSSGAQRPPTELISYYGTCAYYIWL